MPRTIAIHVPDDSMIARVDAAAEAAGETRSAFMLKAALLRADGGLRDLKPAKRKALALEIGEAAVKALGR